MRCLAEVGVVESSTPPSNRRQYLDIEQKLLQFAREIKVNCDELDLVLWSMKTGEILK